MSHEVTITITVGSSREVRGALGTGSDSPPVPLSADALGSPDETSGNSGARSSESPPTPMPLDRLRSAQQDSVPPAPSPQDAMPPASDGGDPPSPMPLEELQPKERRR